MRERYGAVIVVEGKNDALRIRRIYDADVIVTGGLSCPAAVIDLIRETAKRREIVIFTDPDSPGNRIRHKILAAVPEAKQAFIAKEDAIGRHKVGVEHAKDETIRLALANLAGPEAGGPSLSYDEYLELGLAGQPDSAQRRRKAAKALHIGYANGKTFYHWLKLVLAGYPELKEILDEK